MSLTAAQRQQLERRLREKRARVLRALNRSTDGRSDAIPWARSCDKAGV